MPRRALYSVERCGASRPTRGGWPRRTRARRRGPHCRGGGPGASPAVSREPRRDHDAGARPAGPRRRGLRDRRHPRASRERRHRGRVRRRPDRRPDDGRRPGQDLPPRGLRGHPRSARRARPDGRARRPGHHPHRPRHRERQAVRPGGRRQARRSRRGDRDDRRRRRGAARGGGAELGRRGCRLGSRAVRTHRRRAARARTRDPRDPGAARRRGLQHGRGVPRRDRRLSQSDLGQHVPAAARDGPREGGRPALRREPAPAGGVLPRDHASQWHAGGRHPGPGRPTVVQQSARPRRGLPDRPRLHGTHGRDRQAHRSGGTRVARRARRGLPACARDRSGGLVRRDRRGEPRARRSDGEGDRGQLVRGGRRARVQPVGPRDPQGQDRARS